MMTMRALLSVYAHGVTTLTLMYAHAYGVVIII